MPTEQIPFGVPTTCLQNVVYAVPAAAGQLFSSAALEIGSAFAGPFVASPASATTGIPCSASYFRCTTGAAVVTVRKA